MTDADRFRLHFGPYTTPTFCYGEVVQDQVRGRVTIVGLTNARIPWPIGNRGRTKTFVVYDGLAQAVRRESNQAVCHWWGVTPQTVTKWRKAFGIHRTNEGSTQLSREWMVKVKHPKALPAIRAKARDPVRRAKIAASKLGKPRPPHVIEILRQTNLGSHPSKETLRKMSEAHKRRGTRPPAAGVSWTADEDSLIWELPVREVARMTGRSLKAVYCRRHQLKLHAPETQIVLAVAVHDVHDTRFANTSAVGNEACV